MPYVMSTHLLTYIRPPCLYINAYIDTYILYNIRYYIRIIKYFETAHIICKRKQFHHCNVGYRDYANELFCNLKCLKKV